jgi:hypothetical protein
MYHFDCCGVDRLLTEKVLADLIASLLGRGGKRRQLGFRRFYFLHGKKDTSDENYSRFFQGCFEPVKPLQYSIPLKDGFSAITYRRRFRTGFVVVRSPNCFTFSELSFELGRNWKSAVFRHYKKNQTNCKS